MSAEPHGQSVVESANDLSGGAGAIAREVAHVVSEAVHSVEAAVGAMAQHPFQASEEEDKISSTGSTLAHSESTLRRRQEVAQDLTKALKEIHEEDNVTYANYAKDLHKQWQEFSMQEKIFTDNKRRAKSIQAFLEDKSSKFTTKTTEWTTDFDEKGKAYSHEVPVTVQRDSPPEGYRYSLTVWQLEKRQWQLALQLNNPNLQVLVCVLIVANAVVTALEVSTGTGHQAYDKLVNAEIAFTVVFNLELVLKLLAYGWYYFLDYYNIFDFVLVIGADIADLMRLSHDGSGQSVSPVMALRVVRIFRLLRLSLQMQPLEKMVTAFLKGLQDAVAIFIGVTILIFVIAMVFMSIFRHYGEDNNQSHAYIDGNWGNLYRSTLTVFKIMTEGWVDIYEPEGDVKIPGTAKIFILVTYGVLGIAMMGLLDAVFVDALASARSEHERREEEVKEEATKDLKHLLKKMFTVTDRDSDGSLSHSELGIISALLDDNEANDSDATEMEMEDMQGLRTYIKEKKEIVGLTGPGLKTAIDYASTTLVRDDRVMIDAMVDMALSMDQPATKRDNIKIQERLENALKENRKESKAVRQRMDHLETKMDQIIDLLRAGRPGLSPGPQAAAMRRQPPSSPLP